MIEMDWPRLLMLFGAGAVAGFINVNAGGGSSLTLPALYFLGLDWATANGTNRIALILQNIFAVASFQKNKVFQQISGIKTRCILFKIYLAFQQKKLHVNRIYSFGYSDRNVRGGLN